MEKTALLRLHFIVFLWGFTAILGKMIEVDAPNLVFYRMFFTAGILFFYLRIFRKQSLAVSRSILIKLLGVGTLIALHWLFFFASIKASNVSIALSCMSLPTLFVSVLEPLVFRRKIDWLEIVIGMVIVACILLIFNVEIRYKEGIFYGVLAALFGAVFSVFNGKLYGKTSSGNIIFYEMLFGWLVIAVYYLLMGEISLPNEISFNNLALLLVLASVFTAYPMFESVSLLKYITPFTMALTINLEPVYGIILAYFIFGETEHMSAVFYIASLVMILSIVVNAVVKAKRKQKEISNISNNKAN